MNFNVKVKKILERIYHPPPFSSNGDSQQPSPDSPMGATVHHYGAPKDTKGAVPDLSDTSPLTLQLLQLFSSEPWWQQLPSGQVPADPEQHKGILLFRQWPDHIQQEVLSDLVNLANQAPNPELKVNLTNMEKFLRMMRGGNENV